MRLLEIILAKTAGFCFGVNRAIETLEQESGKYAISTLGPIIHNEFVVNDLMERGVSVIEDVDSLPGGNTLAIRTHGVGKRTIDYAEERAVKIIDLTCPFVKKIHNIVSKHYAEGYKIVIVGNKNHPEVKGINGWCENNAIISLDISDINGKIDICDKVCLVCQTTMDRHTFETISDYVKSIASEPLIFDTICSATNERQKEAAQIAAKVDMMLVVGGSNSSNTAKLTSICKKYCSNTYQIENFEDFPQNINIPKKIGITAGASTPSCIIKEVIDKMVENINGAESFAQEFEEYEKSLITLNTRDVVKGTVMGVSEKGISINLGYKSDGFVPASEVTDDPTADITAMYKEGDEVEVFVVRVNDIDGEVTLSMRKLEMIKGAKEIEEAFESKAILTGKVIQAVNGGVIVSGKGTRVFVPASQASDRFLQDLESIVGDEVAFRIIDIRKMRGRTKVVGSIKNVLVEQKAALSEEFWANIEVGKEYKGIVKSLTKFGAFADIGGVDGLIHISQLSWSKIKDPSEVVSVGDEVSVYVLEFDKEKGKVSLGFKKAEDNPWKKVENELKVDDVIDCKIVRIVPFGAFAEIYPGVDGLIHISQVADKRIAKVEDELTVGQHVQAKVVEIDLENQKIGLSIRALIAPAPEAAEEEAPAEEAAAEEVVAEEVVAEEVVAEEAAVEAPATEEAE
ncbi:MAG: bifunctional 4-hydroxy-3-methylbut-2-enyl diphosphate reductase/30S ribosomal protein S1 [Ruminococcaceae bacterium]|nr:bifunctional 4-hydroxy-3-methylbut-2-enyl diphosphate reductase/30S ribosomal protein S1 [Oscillospiraceae bacterium]